MNPQYDTWQENKNNLIQMLLSSNDLLAVNKFKNQRQNW